MRDDELQRAYIALRAERQQRSYQGEITSSLVDALDGQLPADERERVLLHALEHGHADALKLLHTMREAAQRSSESSPTMSGTAGRVARRGEGRLARVALAAVLLGAVGIPLWRHQFAAPAGDRAEYRSGLLADVAIISPDAGAAWTRTAGDSVFVVWRAIPSAVAYQVEIVDRGGVIRFSRKAGADTTLVLPPRPSDVPNGSGVMIRATTADGRELYSERRLLGDPPG